jgi:AraC-like DNA-binding protein
MEHTRRRTELDRYLKFGLASARHRPSIFKGFHRHNEIELHLVESGRIRYLFSRERIDLTAGNLCVFWGAMPHKLISVENGTVSHWLTIPLPWFLQWNLPENFSSTLLQGKVYQEPDPARFVRDLELFNQWHLDLQSNHNERRKTVLLEVESRLRRLALSQGEAKPTRRKKSNATGAAGATGAEGRVEQLATFIAEHYREPLDVAEIAAAAELNPEYATTLFRKTLGLTLIQYVTEHRISHAQRLLMTTHRKVLDVALDAGFDSLSRFYEAFTKACKQTPGAFRHATVHNLK